MEQVCKGQKVFLIFQNCHIWHKSASKGDTSKPCHIFSSSASLCFKKGLYVEGRLASPVH